jgi:hypothetical protein
LDTSCVKNAARLIAFGLTPSKRPTNDVEYAALVRAFHDEPDLQRTMAEICSGLGLRLLDVSEYGVVLGSTAGSPFVLTVQAYQENLGVDDRLLHGLVHVGLAAYLYPRPEELEAEADVRQVTVAELDSFLRELCEVAARKTPEKSDAPAQFPDLENAFRVYLRWPATKETESGGRGRHTRHAIIARALDKLAEHGLLQPVRSESGTVYKALRRYRVHVRALAAHEALRILRELREQRLEA